MNQETGNMRALVAALLSLVVTLSHAVEVVVTAEVQASSRPTIQGSTNLPDGAKLSVTVTRKESAYHAEVLTEVSSGAFIVGPLSQRGAELNPGLYEVEIAVVAAADQPLAVREVIGGKGERLRGPLAKREGSGRMGVRYTTTFRVGVGTDPVLDRQARERAQLSQTKWWKKHCNEMCENAERFAQESGRGVSWPDCLKACVANPPVLTR